MLKWVLFEDTWRRRFNHRSITTFQPFSHAAALPLLPTTTLISLELDESNPPEGRLTFFTANVSLVPSTYLEITANVGGVTYTIGNLDLNAASNSFSIAA
ncbi:hypothetical protein BT96DRAFT_401401 [Gymnopus androsaceus JB14]|uniref:Uncharacterized protein n=1 Tax=Gymnopus androsaceus JB14 TaxID=1447944 RepID=A0A6A4GWG7_9AGAR|nr:hypothetical protein BT96DRAFT_401401 [Gymnopus androsaceus JB14]